MTTLIPTGTCWCGCGEKTSRGAFFAVGHDKRAESAIVKVVYGSAQTYWSPTATGQAAKMRHRTWTPIRKATANTSSRLGPAMTDARKDAALSGASPAAPTKRETPLYYGGFGPWAKLGCAQTTH